MNKQQEIPVLRRVYWETTAGCNLRCIHCRRLDVLDRTVPEELTLSESEKFIDDLANMGKPVLILSGGEPLFRHDIFALASYAHRKGLPVALSTNGTLLTKRIARQIKESGIYYASISLDGAKAETHDLFRGKGNFDRALQGFQNLKEFGIKVQVNFTVTKQNVGEVPEIYQLAQELGAQALYIFLLVPVGCGVQIAESQMLSAQEVEEWLKWVAEKEKDKTMELRAICAPQFYRVKEQILPYASPNSQKRLGCLAGIHICFISHNGEVFPCGYLPLSAGNVKKTPLSEIWKNSELFARLRDYELLNGKCGECAFKVLCGGCRARAYSHSGSELIEEPFCDYEPSLQT